jgi:hypothetical protein
VVPPAVQRGLEGIVRGTLVDDSTRAPLANGTVVLVNERGERVSKGARTDSSGRFAVTVYLPGAYRLLARRSNGVGVVTSAIAVTPGEDVVIAVPLADSGLPRSQAEIVDRRTLAAPAEARSYAAPSAPSAATPDVDEFVRRRARMHGTLLEGSALRRRGAETVAQLLRAVGGPWSGSGRQTAGAAADRSVPELWRAVSRTGRSMGQATAALAPAAIAPASCRIAWYLDGDRVAGDTERDVAGGVAQIPTAELVAIELYRSVAEVPTELADGGVCAAVSIWTARRR